MGLNKIILQGNLAADPEFKTTPSGVSVTTFRIAVGRRFAKPDDEVKADFFTIVAWRGTAEFVSKHFNKGSNIIVVGNLQNRSWTDNDGNKRYVTEVVAEECYFGGNKEKGAEHTPVGNNFVEIGEDDELPFN